MQHPAARPIETLPLTAMVVDDHPLFCDALSLTLRSLAEFDDIATAGTLQEALDRISAEGAPGFILLDLNLPDVNGLDGLVRLRGAAPVSAIIVASSMADNRMISYALKAGANGFVPKHSQRSVFRRAFDAVRDGLPFVPDDYIAPEGAGGDNGQGNALDRLATLTNQQARILGLICEGKLNKQIAYDLTIAETTVKAHVTAIMRKLGVHSRTQAVLIAQEARFAKVLPSED
ncbi:LuxR C-terminal-related transcriptional regulator [Primorskyibacter marinus]|uniref:LuxR C-terminal-related transcriptional regulator n=1 Tax=Primorskyibacter marinus TaxID=1977320 RepID=UPI000E303654|nr:response regulator transcription factor [Primorskyibacter marinus]